MGMFEWPESARIEWPRLAKPLALLLAVALLTGCGQKEYYAAVQAQNDRILKQHNDREERLAREETAKNERLMQADRAAIEAVGRTPDKTDDVLVPLMIAQRETISTIVAANKPVVQPPVLQIQPPETAGDFVQKSTGLVLGAGGMVVGAIQSNNMKDVAVAGIAGAGVHNYANGKGSVITSDSQNAGSKNTAGGSQKITASSGGAAATPGDTEANAAANEAFKTCSAQGGTMGGVASCMALAGVDVEISHGQMLVDGEPYTAGNEYTGYTKGKE